MDPSLIGPQRRQRTRVGDHHRARLLLTIADLVGLAAGAAIAALVIVLVVV